MLGASFDDRRVLALFRDVFEATCKPDLLAFVPVGDKCSLDCATQTVHIEGKITAGRTTIAEIRRTLDFRVGIAHHAQLIVEPDFRGYGIAAIVLRHALDFYARADVRQIALTAALTSGPYYWAKLGFDFLDENAALRVRTWALRVNAKLDLGLDVAALQAASASDLATLGIDDGPAISMAAIADAFPDDRSNIDLRVREQKFNAADEIPAGQAILLSGPKWEGRLLVNQANMRVLDGYVQGKLADFERVVAGC